MRHAPVAVHRVTVEAAADVIAHPAERHRPQRLRHHRQRHVVAGALVLAQQEQQFTRPGKLRRIAEPAAAGIEGLLKLLQRVGQRFLTRVPAIVLPARHGGQPVDDLRRRLHHVQAIVAPGPADLREDIHKRRPAVQRGRREIGAAVEGLQVRRQPHAHRPPAGAGGGLHERHVDAIDVGPLFAIDLDRNEEVVEHAGHPDALERLPLHHVAPVTGGVADGEKDRLAAAARGLERLGDPTDTNRPGCSRAEADRGSAPSLVDSALLDDTRGWAWRAGALALRLSQRRLKPSLPNV